MFRYPGGKVRLGKKINKEIHKQYPNAKEKEWIVLDGFVGGGGSLLNMAKDFPSWKFVINDLNSSVAGFWRFFISASDNEWGRFYQKIEETHPTIDLYNEVFEKQPDNDVDTAFKMLFLNKTSFNGYIIARLPIGGKAQSGKWRVDEYWNPTRLIRNFDNARDLLHNRIIGNGSMDTVDLLEQIDVDFVYLDPPYLKHGSQWYGIDFGPSELEKIRSRLNLFSRWSVSINSEKSVQQVFKDDVCVPIKVTYTASSAHRPKKEGGIKESSELLVFPKGDINE